MDFRHILLKAVNFSRLQLDEVLISVPIAGGQRLSLWPKHPLTALPPGPAEIVNDRMLVSGAWSLDLRIGDIIFHYARIRPDSVHAILACMVNSATKPLRGTVINGKLMTSVTVDIDNRDSHDYQRALVAKLQTPIDHIKLYSAKVLSDERWYALLEPYKPLVTPSTTIEFVPPGATSRISGVVTAERQTFIVKFLGCKMA